MQPNSKPPGRRWSFPLMPRLWLMASKLFSQMPTDGETCTEQLAERALNSTGRSCSIGRSNKSDSPSEQVE
jgi:hypothetical protein